MAIVARWTPADRAYFDDIGGFMRAGGAVKARSSFEAAYIPENSETGDPHRDRYAVGSSFETLGTFDDPAVFDEFPLALRAEKGQPVVCSVVE